MAPIAVRASVSNGGRKYHGRAAVDQLWLAGEKLVFKIRVDVTETREAQAVPVRLLRLGPYPDQPPHDLEVRLQLSDLPGRNVRAQRRAIQTAAIALHPLFAETSWNGVDVRVNGLLVDRSALEQALHRL